MQVWAKVKYSWYCIASKYQHKFLLLEWFNMDEEWRQIIDRKGTDW